jgi:hypothetical protein
MPKTTDCGFPNKGSWFALNRSFTNFSIVSNIDRFMWVAIPTLPLKLPKNVAWPVPINVGLRITHQMGELTLN